MTALLQAVRKTAPIHAAQASGIAVTVQVGIDWGNERTFAVGSPLTEDGSPLTVTFPSAIALMAPPSAELFRQRGGGAASWGLLGPREHIYQVEDGLETPVGALALLLERTNNTSITTGRGDDDRYVSMGPMLADTALALLYPHAEHITARLCVGLPLKLWSAARRDAIVAALVGPRKVFVDGREVAINVTSVQVNAEGHAAWLTLPESRKSGYSLVIDIGSRTAIAAMLRDGVVERTATAEMGIGTMIDNLSANLAATLRPLYMQERYELLDALRAGQGYTVAHRGRVVDVAKAARTLFRQAAPRILQMIAPEIALGQAQYADAVGGGVYFLGPDLQQAWKAMGLATDLVLADDPETLTAWGYYTWLSGNPMPTKRGKRTAGK